MVIAGRLRARLRAALAEDVGAGDVTTRAIVPAELIGEGVVLAKARGVFCGAPVAEAVWRFLSRRIDFQWLVEEGERVRPGRVIARLRGPYAALLTGERVALNFLQRLSGVATLARRLVERAGGPAGPAICDTRKTTPLWRDLERYAVRVGGGLNHRFGLADMILVKANHVRAAGAVAAPGAGAARDLAEAIRRARRAYPNLPAAAEARSAEEAAAAAAAGARLILLDNLTPREVRRALRRGRRPGVLWEVSGGLNVRNIAAYAATGVDRLSVGALTHSAPALDLSLEVSPLRPG